MRLEAFLDEMRKIAAMGTNAILPAAPAHAAVMPSIPRAAKAPVIGSGDFGATQYISPGMTAAQQNMPTVPPRRAAAAPPPSSFPAPPPGRGGMLQAPASAPPPSVRVVPASQGPLGHAPTIPAPAQAAHGRTVMPAKLAEITPPTPSRPQPMTAVAKGPSIPRPGGMKPPPVPGTMEHAFFGGAAAAKANPLSKMKLGSAIKKVAKELTEESRGDLPRKDFAVPASKSNTGDRAYPIPDRQHAASALGFAKMHGDKADIERVRAKIQAKFPDMLNKAGSVAASLAKALPAESGIGKHLLQHAHAYDLGGLGILAAPPAMEIAHQVTKKDPIDKMEVAKSGLELAGLGTLAAPVALQALHKVHA